VIEVRRESSYLGFKVPEMNAEDTYEGETQIQETRQEKP